MEISKSDWKLFREKLPDWQENYVERLLKRYIKNLNDESKPASTKFWELEKQIKKIGDTRELLWNWKSQKLSGILWNY